MEGLLGGIHSIICLSLSMIFIHVSHTELECTMMRTGAHLSPLPNNNIFCLRNRIILYTQKLDLGYM